MSHLAKTDKNEDMRLYRKGFSKKNLKHLEKLQRLKDSLPQAKRAYDKLLSSCEEHAEAMTYQETVSKRIRRRVKLLSGMIGQRYIIFSYDEYYIRKSMIEEEWPTLSTSLNENDFFQNFSKIFFLRWDINRSRAFSFFYRQHI
jgi:hypothetical protein